jgi:uncharacterized membrane protein YecN with MAPEG domain
MTLPITSITALFAGLLILLLTLKVVQLRRRDGVVLGDNHNRRLAKAIRGHANAVEQLPIALIVMGLTEAQGAALPLLAAAAILLIVGRIMHAVYFAIHGTHWRMRAYGMLLTMIAQAALLLALLVAILT